LISHLPQSQVFFPASPLEFNLLFKAVYQNGKINYFRLPEKPHGIVFNPEQIRVGKAIVVNSGRDLTLVVIGPLLKVALEAAAELENQEVSVEVLYYPTIKPFDAEAVCASGQKTGRILVLEEASSHDGVFNYVLRATKHLQNIQYVQMAVDHFIHEYGTYEELCESLGFSAGGILRTVQKEFLFENCALKKGTK
jgi:transketolase